MRGSLLSALIAITLTACVAPKPTPPAARMASAEQAKLCEVLAETGMLFMHARQSGVPYSDLAGAIGSATQDTPQYRDFAIGLSKAAYDLPIGETAGEREARVAAFGRNSYKACLQAITA